MKMRLPAIRRRRRRRDESAPLECAQGATQVAAIETERLADLAGGGIVAMRQLVEDARFGEREVAPEVAVAEGADVARVEAVEVADGSVRASSARIAESSMETKSTS
jgi:hypothetical protein